MRHLPKVVWIGIVLLVGGVGCGQKAAERVTAGIDRLQKLTSADTPIHIAVDPIGSVRIDDGRPQQLATMTSVMQERAGLLKHLEIDPAQITIRIRVDDEARYANFAHAVDACRASGFFKFEVVVEDEALSFDLTPADSPIRAEDWLPPLKVRLRAANDGNLIAVSLNDRQLKDASQLPNNVLAVVGTERGPGSFHDAAEIEFYCDDNLRFRHLAAAYLGVSRCELEEGKRAALVKTIRPGIRWSTQEVLEDEFIEEMPIEPVDVETAETGFDLESTSEVFVEPAETAILPTFSFDDLPPDAPINIDDAPLDVDDALPDDGADDDSADDSVDDKPNDAAVIKPEPPVAAALQWLVNHQSPNGSWDFDHRGVCKGRCDGAGTATGATNAATAMALLPFLAVGQTHQRGEHRQAIKRGVAFLAGNGKVENAGSSYLERGGTMYSQGLTTMALCETYRQTKDEKLKIVCQQALNFITHAQDPVGGGWRYMPRQPGDTSVGGWQIAGLRSGQLAGLTVPTKTLKGATRFLDSVQSEDGQKYGYATPGAGRSTTASGLVSRIHLGWQRNNEAWRGGVARLKDFGPSKTDMYFNFHATQAIAQHGGDPWKTWRTSIGDLLLASQATEGHAAGSWRLGHGQSADRGGRIYSTALATLILTIDRRQLGIFQVEESDE